MKYLKTFENQKYKYKIGDYILLNFDKIYNNFEKEGYENEVTFTEEPFVKIIDIEKNADLPYLIEFYNDTFLTLRPKEIIRLLTPEEIDDYKLKKQANKYNL